MTLLTDPASASPYAWADRARQALTLAKTQGAQASRCPDDYLADFIARTHAREAQRLADLACASQREPVPIIRRPARHPS